MIETKAENKDVFLFKDIEKVVEENIACRDSKRKQKSLHDNYWNKRIPNRGRQRKRPNPEGAAHGMRGKRCPKRASKQKSITKEIADYGDCPEQRVIPNFTSYGMRHKSRDGNKRNDEVKSSFFGKVQHREKHGEETNNGARVLDMRAVEQEIKDLHQEHGNDAG